MAKYRVNYWFKSKPKTEHQGPVRDTPGQALADLPVRDGLKVATLLRDSEGEDMPCNAGKFFLDRIIK